MANITATMKKMKMAGANGKRVDTLGSFVSLEEVISQQQAGFIIPDPDFVNVKSVVKVYGVHGYKEYEYSHSLTSWVEIGRGDGSQVLANAYIRLAGTDEHIEFQAIPNGASADCLMNFAKDFTLTVKIPVMDTPENGQQVKLFSNGSNAIQFTMGNSNYGIYVNDGSINAGANTWFEWTANNELTFVHDATAKTIRYYVNGVSKATVNISNRVNNSDGNFKIGGMIGSHLLKGGIDDVAAWDIKLSDNDMQQVRDNVALVDRSAYSDAIVHCKCGEDVYPHVSDLKNNLVDGTLVNGSPDDFVAITAQ